MDVGSVPGEIGILPEYREVTGTPRELNGPIWALVEIEGSKGSVGHAPQGPNRIGLGQGGRPPLSFSSSLFPSPSPTPTRKGWSPTPSGSRTPPLGAPLPGRPPPPLAPLYTGAGGTVGNMP